MVGVFLLYLLVKRFANLAECISSKIEMDSKRLSESFFNPTLR